MEQVMCSIKVVPSYPYVKRKVCKRCFQGRQESYKSFTLVVGMGEPWIIQLSRGVL